MKILVHSPLSACAIEASLGLPDYSYYFVLRDFLPVLHELGDVHTVDDPERQVDTLYEIARQNAEPCVFLSFLPPQKTTLNLSCPTIPVFAWEFSSIPDESWQGDERQDWRHVFSNTGQAITHAEIIVGAVKQSMGQEYPIVAIPSPVWDKFAELRTRRKPIDLSRQTRLQIRAGVVVDTNDPAIAPYIRGQEAAAIVAQAISQHSAAVDNRRASADAIELRPVRQEKLEPINHVEPPHLRTAGLYPKLPNWKVADSELVLSGIVFTTLFNPLDGRKNWRDMLSAFCAAFRNTPDATLVFKLGHHDYESAMHEMLILLARMPRYQCRVILLHGYLAGEVFDDLIEATTFIVNASHGEGQCLPLMEFLSCGIPAIAPRHSAMLDYIDEEVAFVVDSWLDATAWSHDPRLAYRTLRHQIDWLSLKNAYLAAYQCVKLDPERYERMAEAAIERMQKHCSRAKAKQRLQEFIQSLESNPVSNEPKRNYESGRPIGMSAK